MADEFIYCPQCESTKIVSADFDDDEEDMETLECEDCGWQGTSGELVCKDEEETEK
jgi:transcription elongation factor Elf1